MTPPGHPDRAAMCGTLTASLPRANGGGRVRLRLIFPHGYTRATYERAVDDGPWAPLDSCLATHEPIVYDGAAPRGRPVHYRAMAYRHDTRVNYLMAAPAATEPVTVTIPPAGAEECPA